MNDDDFYNILRNEAYQKVVNSTLNTQKIYDMLRQIDIYSRKDTDMAYTYNRGYYNDTRGDEVATAVLDAYANGVEFETLVQKNRLVRQYWYQIQSEKANKLKKAEQENLRRQKAAEKKKLENAKRAEVAAKLTPEELAAFGLTKKGYHK